MTENNVTEPARKTKPVKTDRKRRNFAQETSALQGRIDLALKLLRKAKEAASTDGSGLLTDVAIATLEGE